MTSLATTFEHFFDRTNQSIATVLTDYGQGRYECQTEAGHKLILTGQANVGDKVFYDVYQKKIIEQAPNITFVDIPV